MKGQGDLQDQGAGLTLDERASSSGPEPGTRPLCKCHEEPMLKNGKRESGEQGWRCAPRYLSRRRRWRANNPEEAREQDRRWRENNPEKKRAKNEARVFVGAMYLGMFGFTDSEREKLLEVANGKAD